MLPAGLRTLFQFLWEDLVTPEQESVALALKVSSTVSLVVGSGSREFGGQSEVEGRVGSGRGPRERWRCLGAAPRRGSC